MKKVKNNNEENCLLLYTIDTQNRDKYQIHTANNSKQRWISKTE